MRPTCEAQNISDIDPELTETIQRVYPTLTQKRRRGRLFAMLYVACSIVAFFGLWAVLDEDQMKWLLVPFTFGVIGVFHQNDVVMRGQQKVVMPALAAAVGLRYQQDASGFATMLPSRLLPKADKRKAEDFLSGTVGGRRIQMAEVTVETGGKRSRTLFSGFVLRFENVAPLPEFFVAPKQQTDAWFSRMQVLDLVETDVMSGPTGKKYGVWLAQRREAQENPALSAVLDILTDLDKELPQYASLFSATSTGEEMHIAFDKGRDLFQIGGLFASKNEIIDTIKRALYDLNIPLKIVSRLIEAERQALDAKQD